MIYEILENNREGDHIVYFSDLTKIKQDYPEWDISKNIKTIFSEIIDNWLSKNE